MCSWNRQRDQEAEPFSDPSRLSHPLPVPPQYSPPQLNAACSELPVMGIVLFLCRAAPHSVQWTLFSCWWPLLFHCCVIFCIIFMYTLYLYFLQLMGSWLVLSLWLLWKSLLWPLLGLSFSEHSLLATLISCMDTLGSSLVFQQLLFFLSFSLLFV